MKILTIQNGKGGIGKTTTAWAMATGLPRKYPEHRALAIDFEPSGNLTYLMDGDFTGSPTMYHVFNGDVDIRAAIQHTSQGNVIAGNSSLENSARSIAMPSQRNIALDRFRGLTIILMIIVNDLWAVEGFPSILKHPHDKGFTLADIVAPFFIFAIAAS